MINDPFFEKGMPNNTEAERSVLGAILLENDLCYQALELLDRKDFFLDVNRRIYDKMLLLTERQTPIDLVTLSDELRRANEFEQIGGASYIALLIDGVPRTDTIEHYAKIIKSKARLRSLITICNQIIASCFDEEDESDEIIEKAEQMIFELGESRSDDSEDIAVIAARLAEYYEQKTQDHSKLIGLSTGYKELDKRTSGLQEGVTIIAGRPGHSKSSCAINIACNVVNEGGVVYYCSPESSKEQIGHRVLASEARIDSLRLREGRMTRDEWRSLLDVLGRLAAARFKIDDSSRITPETLLNRARRYKVAQGKLDLLIVDYVQLMARHLVDGKRFMNLRMAVQYVSAYLVHISRVLHVPVLALVQLGRDVDTRPGHRPQLSDLMESAALEQDSDLILFLLRLEKYEPTEDNKGLLKIIFGKFRDGSTADDIDMYFIEKYTRIESITRD